MKFVRRRGTTGAREWRYYATEELLAAERVGRRGLFAVPGGATAA